MMMVLYKFSKSLGYFLRFHQNYFDTHRRRNFRNLPGWTEFAGLRVDAKGGNRIGVLVGGEQKIAGRVDGKVAGRISAG